MIDKLFAALMLAGALLFASSLVLLPYKNPQLFHDRYMTMGSGDSQKYWEMRDEMLTPKYMLQDYGLTVMALALGIRIFTRSSKLQPHSPSSRFTLVALAVALPFLMAGAYVFDLFQGMFRGEFPHWADSLGIPLMGVPIIFLIFLVWALLHLVFLSHGYAAAPLKLAFSRRANYWLLTLSALTVAFAIFCFALGQYWYGIPGVAWLYYYLSLAAGRRAAITQRQQGT